MSSMLCLYGKCCKTLKSKCVCCEWAHTHTHTQRLQHSTHLFRQNCGHLLRVLRNSERPRKNSLNLLQEVKSDVKDSRSLPFVTKHSGTWKKTSQPLTLPGGKRGDFVKLLLPRPRQSNDGLSKICFLDLPLLHPVERVASCIIFHQHLVAFTGSALLWLFTSRNQTLLLESQLLAGHKGLKMKIISFVSAV